MTHTPDAPLPCPRGGAILLLQHRLILPVFYCVELESGVQSHSKGLPAPGIWSSSLCLRNLFSLLYSISLYESTGIYLSIFLFLGSFLVWGIYQECSYKPLPFLLLNMFSVFGRWKTVKCEVKGRSLELGSHVNCVILVKLLTFLNPSAYLKWAY